MKEAKSRYRVENGEPCVDVGITDLGQLFDNRDPAPFGDRDLDPGFVEYLYDASEDLARHRNFRVVIWLAKPSPPGEIEHAIRAHFTDELARIRRRRRQHRRVGLVALVIAVALIVALISISQWIPAFIPGSLGSGLKEGVVIAAWVLMWRPVEVLIYDWIPVHHESKILRRLLNASLDVRVGAGPDLPRPEVRT